jgi:uncharacterized protein (DUF1684 family)
MDTRIHRSRKPGGFMTEEAKLKANALPLLDWRRQVAFLYAEIRATPEPRIAHEIWQAGRNRLLRSHPESPIPADRRSGFTGVPVASYDPSLRFIAKVDTGVAPVRLQMKTGTDGIVLFERAGVVRLADVGELDVWWLVGYGGGVFLPIKDTRTDGVTYGGGRYVLDTVKGADLGGSDGHLVVDLNFAYNPSCAYDPAWACPLAQVGNTVPVPVNAGELMAPR